MKLVCIPAYNEEKIIGDIIKKSLQYADKVIVCDDGSADNTAKIARESGAQVISHKKNQGYGAAIITLFDAARKENSDIMITIDGDGQHDPEQIPILINTLQENNVDVVIGSRFLDGKSETPGYRKRGIKIITSTANFGADFKVTDSQSGFRAYSKKAIESIHPTETGMAVSTEILLKISNKGLSLAEVPISISYGNDTSTQNPVPHGIAVLMSTLKFISVKHPIPFYGFPGMALVIAGSIMGYQFLDVYLHSHIALLGSLFAAILLFLVGTILCVTAVILFSMATLIREKN
ncbi:Glycosyltransferase, cell wall synthesis-related [Nitrosotalea devaniterrae]|uniref:Glycosyltransferase, cell wall synthesis-related n=1 Tax=Nitrosotalea devaniterrae TaxID=1078905 RepID=A0A128A0Q1_9ARCH|nr:Glycosyltransferase, cell wall synthesis-related [Candidatus Nitrosotalea devanaterra]